MLKLNINLLTIFLYLFINILQMNKFKLHIILLVLSLVSIFKANSNPIDSLSSLLTDANSEQIVKQVKITDAKVLVTLKDFASLAKQVQEESQVKVVLANIRDVLSTRVYKQLLTRWSFSSLFLEIAPPAFIEVSLRSLGQAKINQGKKQLKTNTD